MVFIAHAFCILILPLLLQKIVCAFCKCIILLIFVILDYFCVLFSCVTRLGARRSLGPSSLSP